jgi:hypothetical protein
MFGIIVLFPQARLLFRWRFRISATCDGLDKPLRQIPLVRCILDRPYRAHLTNPPRQILGSPYNIARSILFPFGNGEAVPTARACAIYYTYMPSTIRGHLLLYLSCLSCLFWLLFNLFYLFCPALSCSVMFCLICPILPALSRSVYSIPSYPGYPSYPDRSGCPGRPTWPGRPGRPTVLAVLAVLAVTWPDCPDCPDYPTCLGCPTDCPDCPVCLAYLGYPGCSGRPTRLGCLKPSWPPRLPHLSSLP